MTDITEAVHGLYTDYVNLKLHFKGQRTFDEARLDSWWMDPETLAKRSDFNAFLSTIDRVGRDRMYNRNLIITMFLVDRSSHISDLAKDENIIATRDRMNRLRCIEDLLFNDFEKMNEEAVAAQKEFVEFIQGGPSPYIIKKLKQGVFSYETGAILDYITGFTRLKTADPYWEKIKDVLPRYLHFVRPYIDVDAVKESVTSALISASY